MNEINKFGAIIVLICWGVGAVVAAILGLLGPYNWWFSYLLGLATALFNFSLLIKSSRRLEQLAKVDDVTFNPKKFMIGGYAVRILIFVVVFAAIAFNQYQTEEPRIFLIPAFIGYLTLKLVVIIYSLIKKGKVMKE